MNPGMASDLLSVRDELDIQRVITDYAYACDNGDWALLKSVFADDAYLDYSSTGGPTGSRGEVVAWLEQSLGQVLGIQHVVSNFQIDLDQDRATVRAMFFTSVRLRGLDQPLMTGGYYDEELLRTGGGWKIQRLVEDNRWMHPPTPEGEA